MIIRFLAGRPRARIHRTLDQGFVLRTFLSNGDRQKLTGSYNLSNVVKVEILSLQGVLNSQELVILKRDGTSMRVECVNKMEAASLSDSLCKMRGSLIA